MGNCCSIPAEERGSTHDLQNYNPVHYLPDSLAIRNPNRIVSHVHFIAQTLLQNGGNHWTMSLQTSLDEAVCINMAPGDLIGAQVPGHGYRGQMEIIHQDHFISKDQQAVVTIPAAPGHPVTDFIDVIIDAGNHEYDFTTAGRGCTGWMLDQYRLFLELGLIRPEFNAIENAINQEWIGGQPANERIATRGYYMRDTRGGGWSTRGGRGGVRSSGR